MSTPDSMWEILEKIFQIVIINTLTSLSALIHLEINI